MPRTLPLIGRSRRLRVALGLLTAGAAAVTVTALPAGNAAAADQVRTGNTASTALASCWDVKQVTPTAPSGLYWLVTPALRYPQQFWCDQTTDGGGWVLIGRGREGWSFVDEGQGSAAQVAAPSHGPEAFAPKLLPATTVDALLGGAAVSTLPDGIRLRRATNLAGTSWQEARLRPSTMSSWHWALNGGYPLTSISFDGRSGSGGSTAIAGFDAAANSLVTVRLGQNRYLTGFGYNQAMLGSTSPTAYLWAGATSYAVPFTQAYLRPTLRWADLQWPSVAGGLPAAPRLPVMGNLAAPQPAGVSGLANGRTSERDTEVRAMVQLGSRMFVGGNFAQVDEYGRGSSTSQKYLAAFDVATGAFVPTFLPALDGKVNALAALPDGKLAVGGEFKTVDGVPAGGLVVLDPSTGATDPTFRVSVTQNPGTTPGYVTALDVFGSTLYVGGGFNHIAGGGAGPAYTKRAARLDAVTGRPDPKWNPAFDGTPIFMKVSQSGDRVYVGGFMAKMNDGANPALRFAVVTTTTPAAPVAGLKTWVSSSVNIQYQQTGVEVGDRFWLGGAEHSFFMYDRSDFSLLRGAITRNDNGTGGDFQASAVDGGIVYGSCHCILSNTYGDGRAWPTPPTFDSIGSTRYIGAFDARTGVQVYEFLPQLKTRAVRGPWALTVDSAGCLWAGGDTTQTKSTAGVWQSSGGFSRFCRTDSTPPTVPSAVKAVAAVDGTVTVGWTGSADNAAGTLRYVVYRDSVPVWSGPSWKVTLPPVSGTTTYAVRAMDRAGNLSATTTPVTLG